MTTLKKLRLNIERIGSKTKKRRERDLTSLPKKSIKSPEAKRAKGKNYYKEGYRTSAQTYNALALNWSFGV
jgi:hypothetical protein